MGGWWACLSSERLMGEITSWEMFDTFLRETFKNFQRNGFKNIPIIDDFNIKGTFQRDFGNFDTVEDKVRIFFFDYRQSKIIETEIPDINRRKIKFYFQNLYDENGKDDENGKFLFKISMIDEDTIKIKFQERTSKVKYDSSIYFSECLNRAYEKCNKLADSEENKIIAYRFSNSGMTEDIFFKERVEDFCLRHNFSYISKSENIAVPEWTLTDIYNQEYSLKISNIAGSPCIFFTKLAPSAVLREDGTDENDLLIHIADDLKKEFQTFSNLFQREIVKKVYRLLDVKKWFQVKKQPQSWEENYVAIEKVRVGFKELIVKIDSNEPQLCKKLKRWFKKLLELHFGLRARQLGSRKKYELFYEHRITNAIAEHIMDEPGVNEAFAHFQSSLQQCGAL